MKSKVLVIVNDIYELEAKQTTTMIIESLLGRGLGVLLTDVQHFLVDGGGLQFAGVVLSKKPQAGCDSVIAAIKDCLPQPLRTESLAFALLRTNPARDYKHFRSHVALFSMLAILEEEGLKIINSPARLLQTLAKESLAWLDPEMIPPTLITHQPDEIRSFAERCEAIVIKPASGTRGEGVQFYNKGTVISDEALSDRGLEENRVICQEFIPEVTNGDLRIMVLDGEIMHRSGTHCVFLRKPQSGSLLCNIHQGGSPALGEPNGVQLQLARKAAAILKSKGIDYAGIDLIANKIIEVNVMSPGGFRLVHDLTGMDFAQDFVSWIFEEVEKSKKLAS